MTVTFRHTNSSSFLSYTIIFTNIKIILPVTNVRRTKYKRIQRILWLALHRVLSIHLLPIRCLTQNYVKWPEFPILHVANTVAISVLTSPFTNQCGHLIAQSHYSCENSKLMEINSDVPLCGHILNNFSPLHKEKYIHALFSQINFIIWFSYVHQLFTFTFTDIIYNMFKARLTQKYASG
jgi:hypothetical protein